MQNQNSGSSKPSGLAAADPSVEREVVCTAVESFNHFSEWFHSAMYKALSDDWLNVELTTSST